MILPDINLLVYAHNEAAPLHKRARKWWADLMSREAPIALSWAVIFGFVRLVTHPSVLAAPLTPGFALDFVDTWTARANVVILEPGPRHLRVARDLFDAVGVGASLTTDVHLAALAIEHQCELHSNDADFRRFPGLRLRNPIA